MELLLYICALRNFKPPLTFAFCSSSSSFGQFHAPLYTLTLLTPSICFLSSFRRKIYSKFNMNKQTLKTNFLSLKFNILRFFVESGGGGLDGVPSDDGSWGGIRTGGRRRRWMEHFHSTGKSTPFHPQLA